jgi:hypothetical protein
LGALFMPFCLEMARFKILPPRAVRVARDPSGTAQSLGKTLHKPTSREKSCFGEQVDDYVVINRADSTRSDLCAAEEFRPDQIVSVGSDESDLPNRAAQP